MNLLFAKTGFLGFYWRNRFGKNQATNNKSQGSPKHQMRNSKRYLRYLIFVISIFPGICILELGTWTGVPQAFAAEPLPTCVGGRDPVIDSILKSDDKFLTPLPPVSDHFTRKVLERAQAGIERAESFTQEFDPDTGYMNWLGIAFSAMQRIIDAKYHLIEYARDLRENTACLHVDIFLFQTMMERTRCKLQYAFEQKHFNTILELEKIMVFLQNHYEALLTGARDNAYEDLQWSQKHTFDVAPTWCLKDKVCEPVWYEECTGEAYGTMEECTDEGGGVEWTMCPFHSDYLPPTVIGTGGLAVGYGCDLETLEEYKDAVFDFSKFHMGVRAEYETLKKLLKLRDEFIDASEGLKEDTINLDTWMGREPPEGLNEYWGLTKENERDHHVRLGCSASDGKLNSPPPRLPEDLEELEEMKKDPRIDFSAFWPPKWPQGAAKWEMRGPFSFEKADLKLLREYQNLREEWGKKRPLYYALSGDIDPLDIYSFFMKGGLMDILQELIVRRPLKRWDIYQEKITSASVTQGVDARLMFSETLRPIQQAVSEFAQYATMLDASGEVGGIRNFARGLAYFLRRSCLNRPCNERLECDLLMILNDACFPYTNGGIEAGSTCACLKPLYDEGYHDCYRDIDPKNECRFKEPKADTSCQ